MISNSDFSEDQQKEDKGKGVCVWKRRQRGSTAFVGLSWNESGDRY